MILEKEEVHTIRSQSYEIDISDKERGSGLYTKISFIQENRVNGILESVLDRYSNSYYTYCFDQVDIDVGEIKEEDLETVLPELIEKELDAFFSSNILSENNLRSGKSIRLSNKKLEQFEFFLDHGYFNWAVHQSISPKQLFNEILASEEEGLVTLLVKKAKKKIIRERIIDQFEDAQIEKIVVITTKVKSEFILEYKEKVINHYKLEDKTGISLTSYNKAIWEIILAYIFEDSNGYYNKKEFLNYTLKKIALKYNTTYLELLRSISADVGMGNLIKGDKEFTKIIKELIENTGESSEFESESIEKEEIDTLAIFLENGSKELILNRLVFNRKFRTILKRNTKELLDLINEWMLNAVISNRLLFVLDKSNLDLLVKELQKNIPVEIIRFFENVEKQKTTILEEDKIELSHFLACKNELYFLYLQNHSQVGSIQNILVEYVKSFSKSKVNTIRIYKRMVELIGDQEGKLLKNPIFIDETINKSRNISSIKLEDYKLPESILREFVEVLNSISSDSYLLWSIEFSILLESFSNENAIEYSLIIELLKGDDLIQNKPFFQKFLLEKEGDSIMSSGSKTRNNHSWFLYLFKKGNLPWWKSKFSVQEYNLAFSNTINYSDHKTFVLDRIKEGISIKQLLTYLEKNELELLWEKIDVSPGNYRASFLKEVNQFISNELNIAFTSVGWSMFDFKLELTEVLLEYPKTIRLKNLLSLIFKIDPSNEFTGTDYLVLQKLNSLFDGCKGDSIKAILYEIKNHNLKVINSESIVNRISLIDIVSDKTREFVFETSDRAKSSHELINSLANKLPNHFRECLKESEFRFEIIRVLAEENSNEQFELLVNSLQKEYYYSALLVFKEVSNHLSMENRKKFGFVFYDQILLNIASVKIEFWNSKDWAELIFTSLKSVISIEKSDALIEDYLKRINFDRSKKSTTHTKIVLELISLVNEKFDMKKDYSFPSKITSDLIQDKNKLNKFIQEISLSNLESTRSNLLIELINEYSQIHPSEAKNWFRSKNFRLAMNKKMTYIEKKKLVFTLLKEQQNDYAIWFFNFSESLALSKDDFERLTLSIFDKLFLLIAENRIHIWNALKWSQFLIDECETSLGKQKTYRTMNIVLKEKFKQNPIIHNEFYQFIESISKAIVVEVEALNKEEEDYSKLEDNEDFSFNDPVFISNVGIVILAPYLSRLFEQCDFMVDGEFVDIESQEKAIHLLYYAATGNENPDEQHLFINKILCGFPIKNSIGSDIQLNTKHKETVDGLLEAVISNWKTLGNTSIDGLRGSFFMREGKVEFFEDQIYLKVEEMTFDMLIDSIPWNISQIKLSWMDKLVHVIWR